MHLLVADDNEINLKVACAYLKALGIPPQAIEVARNGREAIDICEQKDIDLVFMDIQMPVLDGLQAAREILQNHQSKPTIVALTANTVDEANQECLDAGMRMVIHKPVTKVAFQEALQLITAQNIQSSSSLSSKPVLDLS